MSNHNQENVEQHILKFSVLSAVVFALLGLVWGAIAGSQMIIFDGIYSFISVILSGLSVYAARSMKIGDDMRFPLGRSQMEPLVITFKSLVIVALCVAAFAKAVITIFAGGQEIDELSAMAYASIGTAGCIGSLLYITWKRKKAGGSVLVTAERMQWFMDTLLSVFVLLGFFAAWIMEKHREYAYYSRYMDPGMVVVFSVFFIRMPIRTLVEGIRDMLQMAPDMTIYGNSRRITEKIAKERGFKNYRIRISKVGRALAYKISFISHTPDDSRSMGELDNIRQEIESGIGAICENSIRMKVSFMHDEKWSLF